MAEVFSEGVFNSITLVKPGLATLAVEQVGDGEVEITIGIPAAAPPLNMVEAIAVILPETAAGENPFAAFSPAQFIAVAIGSSGGDYAQIAITDADGGKPKATRFAGLPPNVKLWAGATIHSQTA